MGVQTCMVVAGENKVPKAPQCQVVIGTPGKLQDLIKRKAIHVGHIKTLVLDEADQLLDQTASMGPQVTQIRRFLPPDLQVLLFSATYPDEVRKFAEQIVPNASVIVVKKRDLTVAAVQQAFLRCKNFDEKVENLKGLYSAMNVSQSIVFVNSRRRAFEVAKSMR